MKYLRNKDGIALVTALMFTLICLAMIMALMHYVLTATKMSAAQKRYKSSLEASYGGTELLTKTIIPKLFTNYSSGNDALRTGFSGTGPGKIDFLMPNNAATKTKIKDATASWGDTISRTVDPKVSPDFTFTLKGAGTTGDFRVYSKIVDTIAGVGLIDESGIDYLDAGIGVAGTSSSTQTPRTPNIYSVEVQGEAAVNPKEKAGLSVLYAY
jgi:hypothetical protein